jgi:hypothetical protein
MRNERVHRQNAVVQQRQAVRRVKLTGPNTDAGGRNEEALNAVAGAAQRLVGMSEV